MDLGLSHVRRDGRGRERGERGGLVQEPGGPKENRQKGPGNQNGWITSGRASWEKAAPVHPWTGEVLGRGLCNRQGLRGAAGTWCWWHLSHLS